MGGERGGGEAVLTFVIDLYTLYLLGALLAHTASSPGLRQGPQQMQTALYTHTDTLPYYHHPTPGRERIDALGQFS